MELSSWKIPVDSHFNLKSLFKPSMFAVFPLVIYTLIPEIPEIPDTKALNLPRSIVSLQVFVDVARSSPCVTKLACRATKTIVAG